jgi:hypothetical protein
MRWITAVVISLRAFAIAAFASSWAQAQQSTDADDRAWRSALESGTAEAWQQYLEQFPAGRHVEEAFRRLFEQSEDWQDPAVGGDAVQMY